MKYLTIDVENINKNLNLFLQSQIKNKKFKVILFVVPELLEKNKKLFLDLRKKGYEIGLHGYKHERWDILSFREKKERLEKAVKIYFKVFKKKPTWFRAPQFSADFSLVKLLDSNGFKYDSSIVQFPISQVLFFPSRFFLYLKQHKFSCLIKRKKLKIKEIPVSSFILPISMFSLRILPFLKFCFVAKCSLFFRKDKNLVFLAHSYEFDDKRIKKLMRFLQNFER